MDRKYHVHRHISNLLKDMLRCCKNGLYSSASDYSNYLFGILLYMFSVGDIDEQTYIKVDNIRRLILKKYRKF